MPGAAVAVGDRRLWMVVTLVNVAGAPAPEVLQTTASEFPDSAATMRSLPFTNCTTANAANTIVAIPTSARLANTAVSERRVAQSQQGRRFITLVPFIIGSCFLDARGHLSVARPV